jgi:enoyl-CoA hydratase
MSSQPVRYEQRDDVAVITMDDGKANALSHVMIDQLHAAIERAQAAARALVLTGRETRFCAGFDLGTMTSGPQAARALVLAGAELLLRMYLHPQPLVAACTGHALAAGALLLLASDTRIGAAGAFKIGLNEVAIQLTLPVFGTELARDRLSKRHFTGATVQARIYDPETACDAGYLDRVVAADQLQAAALAEVQRLAALPQAAYAATKQRARAATVERIRATLHDDVAALVGSR